MIRLTYTLFQNNVNQLVFVIKTLFSEWQERNYYMLFRETSGCYRLTLTEVLIVSPFTKRKDIRYIIKEQMR